MRKQLLVDSVELRLCRGVMQYVTRSAQVLYGLCNFECIDKFEFSISKLRKQRVVKLTY